MMGKPQMPGTAGPVPARTDGNPKATAPTDTKPQVPAPGHPPFPKHMTLLGVATPGIAPLRPGEISEPAPIAPPVATQRYPSGPPASPPTAGVVPAPLPLIDLAPPSSAHVPRL